MEQVEKNLKDEVVFMYENKPMCGVICGKTTFIGTKLKDGKIYSSEDGYVQYHVLFAGVIVDLYEDQVFNTIEDMKATLFSIIKK